MILFVPSGSMAGKLPPDGEIIMHSLFAKIVMLLGALAATVSFGFWNISKGSFSLEILSAMTADQAVGYTKLFAAITVITLLILIVVFMGRDRSNN
jgi:hypothetical protein